MENKWKIIIIALVLVFVWIRLAPAIVWTYESIEQGEHWVEKGWCDDFSIEREWSWWSLRFTSVYPKCKN